MKAIETRYKGYRFRSRLEARWAVFFDALGIQWEYEPEGFVLSTGERYLPDFWLPTFCGGMWAEVKPGPGDWSKARQLCIDSQKPVWKCEGTPDVRISWIYVWEADGVREIEGIPNADQAVEENRMFWCPGYEEPDGSISTEYADCLGSVFLGAVAIARGARFEHGERGAPPASTPLRAERTSIQQDPRVSLRLDEAASYLIKRSGSAVSPGDDVLVFRGRRDEWWYGEVRDWGDTPKGEVWVVDESEQSMRCETVASSYLWWVPKGFRESPWPPVGDFLKVLVDAVAEWLDTTRGARFEHGEQPHVAIRG